MKQDDAFEEEVRARREYLTHLKKAEAWQEKMLTEVVRQNDLLERIAIALERATG